MMKCETSAYKDFFAKHSKFIKKHGEQADEKVRRRPLHILETEGVENAMWPNLYWSEDMCETVVRWGSRSRWGTSPRTTMRCVAGTA